MPTREKETILGSKRLVVDVLAISVLVIVGRVYFHWLFARNAASAFGPLGPREKSMIGLATVVFIINVIALVGGKQLVHRMQDKSFAKAFAWAEVPFLIAVLYFLFPWPWWVVVSLVITPLVLMIDSRRRASSASLTP